MTHEQRVAIEEHRQLLTRLWDGLQKAVQAVCTACNAYDGQAPDALIEARKAFVDELCDHEVRMIEFGWDVELGEWRDLP